MGWGAELRAAIIAVAGAAVIVVLQGLLAQTTGLLFVAGVAGALMGLVAAGSARPRPWVRRFALALAAAVVLVGAVGAWLLAVAEGGTLGLLDYLWATSGLLVPFELVIALLAAAWGARSGPIVG
jgi:hypothetical protein